MMSITYDKKNQATNRLPGTLGRSPADDIRVRPAYRASPSAVAHCIDLIAPDASPMSSTQDPIVRRKLSDEVFDRLKVMITSGDLQPGDAMPSERDLMERFGVG